MSFGIEVNTPGDDAPAETTQGEPEPFDMSEAVQFIEGQRGDEPAQNESTPSDEDEADPEPTDPGSAQEPADNDQGDDEPDAADDDEDEEPDGKPTRKSGWKRQKAKFEAVSRDLETERKRAAAAEDELRQRDEKLDEWKDVYENDWKPTKAALETENEKLRARLAELGEPVDPKEDELSRVNAELAALKRQVESGQKRDERTKQVEAQRTQQALVSKVRKMVTDAAAQHGLVVDELRLHARARMEAAQHLGQPIPRIEDLAAELASFQQFQKQQTEAVSAAKQHEHSQTAPRVPKGRGGGPRDPYPATLDGMTAFVESLHDPSRGGG